MALAIILSILAIFIRVTGLLLGRNSLIVMATAFWIDALTHQKILSGKLPASFGAIHVVVLLFGVALMIWEAVKAQRTLSR